MGLITVFISSPFVKQSTWLIMQTQKALGVNKTMTKSHTKTVIRSVFRATGAYRFERCWDRIEQQH